MDIFSYEFDLKYNKSVAYFSMEFAIDQSLKLYSGGLGFLAGSHLRSAYELNQNLIGIGILWKYGYYDQVRDTNGLMKPEFIEKEYSYLQDTGIIITVTIHDSPVHVKAFLLQPETFSSAPILLMTTNIPENDFLSKTITDHLYDPNESTRIAQSIILGIGGAMLLEKLNLVPDVYHMNEGHSVSLNFYLYSLYKSVEEVKKRVVFTTHTPEMAGNEAHSFNLLKEMSFFYHLQDHEVKKILQLNGDQFNYTLAALKFSRKANGVSKLHANVARQMWSNNQGVCEIISITNAQNKSYWVDPIIETAIQTNKPQDIIDRKLALKIELFKTVADQCGKLFNPKTITIVWARRYAGYKRADLLLYDWSKFIQVMNNSKFPVQVIWAGKPYPEDSEGISMFNKIISQTKGLANCAVLTGYELGLSALLKKGSDIWLNTPRMYREASGTSGMTAAMNGSINLSMPDGWVPEFAKDRENCFLIQAASSELSMIEKDKKENSSLMDILESTILPMYYNDSYQWVKILRQAAIDVAPGFESARLANEYYKKMYHA